ncbi:MAG: DUF4915 domain-containing protein [Rhizomicrobium sp.]
MRVRATDRPFSSLWRPPFIGRPAAEDHCHLNGSALADGKPKYVICVSQSGTFDGWRDLPSQLRLTQQ